MRNSVLYVNIRRNPLENNAAIYAALDLDYDVVLLTSAADLASVGGFREVVVLDTFDIAAARSAAADLAARHAIAGVVAWSDRDVELVAAIAADLGLPGLPPQAARTVRNKRLMREVLGDDPELVARSRIVMNEADLITAIEEIGFPAILKPVSGSGSRGIFDAADRSSALTAYQVLLRYLATERDPGIVRAGGAVLYEEKLIGSEHSVEGVVQEGQVKIAGITDKWGTEPYHLEYLKIHPSALEPGAQERMRLFTEKVVLGLGMDNCAFHLECIADADGRPRLLEVAGRIAGGYITSHLVPLSTGIDFYRAVVSVAVGREAAFQKTSGLFAGARYLIAGQAGTLARVDGIPDVLGLPGIEHVAWESGPAAQIAVPPDNFMSPLLATFIARHHEPEGVHLVLAAAVRAATPVIT